MGEISENYKTKKECPYGPEMNVSCVCSFCERKDCFECLECKKRGKYKVMNECDRIKWVF